MCYEPGTDDNEIDEPVQHEQEEKVEYEHYDFDSAEQEAISRLMDESYSEALDFYLEEQEKDFEELNKKNLPPSEDTAATMEIMNKFHQNVENKKKAIYEEKVKNFNEPEAVARRRAEFDVDAVDGLRKREKSSHEKLCRLRPLGGDDKKKKSYSDSIF